MANLFWSHADEERQHAIQFLQYLRMRGAENNDFFGDTPIKPKEGRFYWSSVDDVGISSQTASNWSLLDFVL